MAILTSIFAVLGSALATMNAMIGEGYTRYFILVGGVALNNVAGDFTGIFLIEGLFESVIEAVTGIPLKFPVFYGISSLLITVVLMPVLIYLFRDASR